MKIACAHYVWMQVHWEKKCKWEMKWETSRYQLKCGWGHKKLKWNVLVKIHYCKLFLQSNNLRVCYLLKYYLCK